MIGFLFISGTFGCRFEEHINKDENQASGDSSDFPGRFDTPSPVLEVFIDDSLTWRMIDLLEKSSRLINEHEIKQATLLLDTLDDLYEKTKFKRFESTYHKLLYEYFYNTQQFELAFEHLRQRNMLEIEAIRTANKHVISEMEKQAGFEEKEFYIKSKQENLRQMIRIGILLFFTVLVIATSVALYFYSNIMIGRGSRIIRDQQQEIAGLTKTLDQLIIEKNAMMRELHHRVKNNLAMLVSIFDYQKIYSTQTEEQQLLQQINHRIVCIGIIHERVFTSKSFKEIPVKRYLSELSMYLTDLAAPRMTTKTEIYCDEAITADSNFCFSLGLILSELFTISLDFLSDSKSKLDCRVSFTSDENNFIIEYSDNTAYSDKQSIIEKSADISIYLINKIMTQFDGTFDFYFGNGFNARLKIPDCPKYE